jgi:hypothetical protein
MDKIYVITDFLHDTPKKIKSGIFEWREHYYEVKYWKKITKAHQNSHFVKWNYKGSLYGIREVSKHLLTTIE